jgi:hypothetical protein
MTGRVASWIGSVICGLLAVLILWFAVTKSSGMPPIRIVAIDISLATAAVLLFPPLWKHEERNHRRYFRLVAAALLAAIGLLMPIETHAVKLDLPAPQSSLDGTR